MRVLTSAAELADATGGHPVAVLDVGAGFVAPAYAVGSPHDGAVAFHRRSDHGVPGSAAARHGIRPRRPCSTTRPCAPGSPAAATGTSACRAA